MTAAEFTSKYSSTEVAFDCTKGWPTGPDLYYRCPSCGDVIASHPKESTQCICRGIMIDSDYGRLSARDEKEIVLLRATKK